MAQVDGFTIGILPTIQPPNHPTPHLKEIQGLLPTMTFATGTNNTVKGNRIESHAIGLQLIKETWKTKDKSSCGGMDQKEAWNDQNSKTNELALLQVALLVYDN